jgi:hypothetical protein
MYTTDKDADVLQFEGRMGKTIVGISGAENGSLNISILLTNDFHHTESRVQPVLIKTGRFSGYYRISKATVMRLRNTLCGIKGCTCGGEFGERGCHSIEVVNQDYDQNYIVQLHIGKN